MPKAIRKIKRLSSKTNLYQDSEIYEQPQQDLFSEIERPVRDSRELPRNRESSHSSIDPENKFKKLNLVRLNKEKTDKQTLLNPFGWNVTDGDYFYETAGNEESKVYSIEKRKKMERIYFGVVLIIASLIILLFSSIASSIKNF